MYPATLISLSSIFGLMATFFQERRGRKEAQTQATLQEYIEWLERGRHTEIVELLRSNQDLMAATDRFMRTGHDEIIDRFDRLEDMLAGSLISTPGWAELTQSLNPNARLSKQAVDILRWFDATGGSQAIMFKHRGGSFLSAQDGSGGQFQPTEPRFFEADLESLVNHDLLLPSFGSKGSPIFTITRPAVDLVQSLDDQ